MRFCMLLMSLLLVGCHFDEPNKWIMEYHPTTSEEREKVAQLVVQLMRGNPDDATAVLTPVGYTPAQAYEAACKIVCRPTMWEYAQDDTWKWNPTGKFRYVDGEVTTP